MSAMTNLPPVFAVITDVDKQSTLARVLTEKDKVSFEKIRALDTEASFSHYTMKYQKPYLFIAPAAGSKKWIFLCGNVLQ